MRKTVVAADPSRHPRSEVPRCFTVQGLTLGLVEWFRASGYSGSSRAFGLSMRRINVWALQRSPLLWRRKEKSSPAWRPPVLAIRRGGQLRAAWRWSWTRVGLAHVGSTAFTWPSRGLVWIGGQWEKKISASRFTRDGKFVMATRPWWSQEDHPGYAESVWKTGRCLREPENGRPLRRRRLWQTSDSIVFDVNTGAFKAECGRVRQTSPRTTPRPRFLIFY
jgi:hypothetical protein